MNIYGKADNVRLDIKEIFKSFIDLLHVICFYEVDNIAYTGFTYNSNIFALDN